MCVQLLKLLWILNKICYIRYKTPSSYDDHNHKKIKSDIFKLNTGVSIMS